jgi:translation initiation factor 2 subunit 3
MEFQPIINVGFIGHVSDGKSTVTRRITDVETQKFSKEKETNITIRLGYANAKIYKCNTCPEPKCYYSIGINTKTNECKHCGEQGILVNHISFVDCPGHNSFMGTMLNGTSVMDYTITVESVVNKTFPAPQTIQHLEAIESNNIPNVAMLLNKVDLVNEITTIDKIDILKEFLQKYKSKLNPIIPISATFDVNIDVICEILAKLKVPSRELEPEKLRMNIIRSFNINLPGTKIENLKGGVVGGSIIKGTVKINDIIYIYPGMIYADKYEPLKAKVITIFSEKTPLQSAVSGGLIALGLDIDPGLTGDDALVGNVIKINNKFDVHNEFYITKKIQLEIKYFENFNQDILTETNKFILNINMNNIQAEKEDNYFVFEKPIYIEKNDNITVSIKNHDGLQVIGTGKLIICENLESI